MLVYLCFASVSQSKPCCAYFRVFLGLARLCIQSSTGQYAVWCFIFSRFGPLQMSMCNLRHNTSCMNQTRSQNLFFLQKSISMAKRKKKCKGIQKVLNYQTSLQNKSCPLREKLVFAQKMPYMTAVVVVANCVGSLRFLLCAAIFTLALGEHK